MNPTPPMALQPFRKSLTAKIFMICFLSIHVPLIAVIAYLAIGFETQPLTLLLLLLGATQQRLSLLAQRQVVGAV